MAYETDAVHLLIVDDDERIRQLLKKFLQRNGFLVTTAADAARARRLLAGLAFDLIVLDVMMPGEDGISLCRELRAKLGAPILLLTARGETSDRILGLEAGADDYLSKPFDPKELLLRINAILRRSAPEPMPAPAAKQVLRLGAMSYDVERGELRREEGEPLRLTATEAGLMRILAADPGATVTRTRLIEEAGPRGAPTPAQERAVDVQITRLRRKIEPDPRQPRYLQTVRGAGYRLAPD
ncbi:DNA-binding protein response regulator PetR [Rubellimicrobium mesophilum DSM 19309]|uniref:DNA-binding protein response regulator PetR n=1 Tax=Rubellimicrobium mesophilum DSM 19309 TaxID=442562 RepID=A0A017HLH1_9RHOB|nr:response regulator transcription factor [Rubellimicrobium mesophilum]EYD75206.1 DNA-binding protein response regulator PetR [Rubellimicrobium mesophilum DSM 19309]